MSCSNCYNGCAETTSDQCVRYTGIDVPVLGIKTGDSLSYVEQALITFLTSTLDGTGIKLTIDPQIICEIVNKNIVECEDLTLVNLLNALIKAICELDTRLKVVEDDFAALEGNYTVGCLTGVTATSGTHAILQAAITKLCGLEIELDALALDVSTNYVKLSQLNSLIAAYLSSLGVSTKYYNRMVPNTVVEYYGPISGRFDASGAGLGDWEKIYLCNGNNGTPDKRGRVGVGATSGMGGGTLNPAVDPAVSGNPTYNLYSAVGSNNVTLSITQIPSHTHVASATSIVTDPGHAHTVSYLDKGNPGDGTSTIDVGGPASVSTSTASTGITVTTNVVNANAGGGLPHPNYQPGLGCYYIMYIP